MIDVRTCEMVFDWKLERMRERKEKERGSETEREVECDGNLAKCWKRKKDDLQDYQLVVTIISFINPYWLWHDDKCHC